MTDPRTRRRLAELGPLQQLRAGRLPRRLVQLLVGLALYGASLAVIVRSALGAAPWDVLHLGLAGRLPLSLGTLVVIVSVVVMLAWIPLRQRPGLGTVANALLVGVAIDATLALLGPVEGLGLRIVLLVLGVALNGVATAMYIGAQLGPGPRDGLMTGIARRTGWSMRLVRTALEVSVVAVGWLLGGASGLGAVGLGTVLYALAIGPVTQASLPYLVVDLPGRSGRSVARGSRLR